MLYAKVCISIISITVNHLLLIIFWGKIFHSEPSESDLILNSIVYTFYEIVALGDIIWIQVVAETMLLGKAELT